MKSVASVGFAAWWHLPRRWSPCGTLALLLGSLWLAAAVHAQGTAVPDGERERIARERAAVEARFLQAQAVCQTRFAVTDCVDDAKRDRREALAPLRARQIALDDVLRKGRAARRAELLKERAGDQQRREREVVLRESQAARQAASAPAPRASAMSAAETATGTAPAAAPAREPRAQKDARTPSERKASAKAWPNTEPKSRPVPSDGDRQRREAEGRARIEARKAAAQARRDEVQRRNDERAAKGKRVESLPVPAGATASVPSR